MLQQMDSHWGITVQFEWFICFSVVCICSASLSLSGWSVEYALYVQLVHCGTVWNPIGCLKIEIQDSDNLFFVSFNLSQSRTVCIPCGWRLKFRTVTGTRGFFGKLVLSVCLDIPNLIFCIHLHPHLCLHQIQASSSFCQSGYSYFHIPHLRLHQSSKNIVADEQERCCFSGALVTRSFLHTVIIEKLQAGILFSLIVCKLSSSANLQTQTHLSVFYYYAFLLRGGRFQEWAGISGK